MSPQSPNGDDEPQGQDDAFQQMFQQFLSQSGMSEEDMRRMGMPTDPAGLQAMFAQVQSMFSASGSDGPVNWQAAKDHARRVVQAGGDPSVTAGQRKIVDDAVQLAQLWVEDHTAFAQGSVQPAAWSRSEWVEGTFETWKEITGPVAESVTSALSDALTGQMPPEVSQMMGGASGMLAGAGGMMFAMQLGQAIGHLASEVVSLSDIGFPLAENRSAMLPRNVEEFGEGLDIPAQEIVIYLAVREVVHARLFHATPWLRSHLIDLVTRFSREIHIDMERIEGLASQIDPTDPTAMQEALGSGVFMPEQSAEQKAVLNRLETVLALIEGWVDVVTVRATANLPAAAALSETIRRRRASGGPAEHAFAALIGLELRPRRMRDAAAFWERVEQRRGLEDRDGLWESPELLPTDEDLDDPEGYESRRGLLTASEDEFDAALRSLLEGESPRETPAEGASPEQGTGQDTGQDTSEEASQDPGQEPGGDTGPGAEPGSASETDTDPESDPGSGGSGR